MTKNNPLFVDSTKLQGDRISTQFELEKVILYDDESLWIIVKTQSHTVRLPMKCQDDETYEARVHLAHQKLVSYVFVIERDGKPLFQSAIQEARATYVVMEDWIPLEHVDYVTLAEWMSDSERLPELPVATEAKPRLGADYGATIKALIEKWDL